MDIPAAQTRSGLTVPVDAAPRQVPKLGALVAGYGSWVNPALIAKIEPVRAGKDWFVVAYLNVGEGTDLKGRQARLTPELPDEHTAQRICDQLANQLYMGFSSNPDGGAWWPDPETGVCEDWPPRRVTS